MNEQVDKDEINAIEITDQVTIDRFNAVKNFTAVQDSELLKMIDTTLQAKRANIKDCKSTMFAITKEDLK